MASGERGIITGKDIIKEIIKMGKNMVHGHGGMITVKKNIMGIIITVKKMGNGSNG